MGYNRLGRRLLDSDAFAAKVVSGYLQRGVHDLLLDLRRAGGRDGSESKRRLDIAASASELGQTHDSLYCGGGEFSSPALDACAAAAASNTAAAGEQL